MGVESLGNSDRDSIGYKLRRGVVATVAAMSGFGLAQGLTSQGVSSQEVSTHPPTALQFFDYEIARLNEVAKGIKKSDYLDTVEVHKYKPTPYGKGILLGGYATNIVSKDGSTWYQVNYNYEKTISGSYKWRDFCLNVYIGNPKVNPNVMGTNNSPTYNFNLLQHSDGRNLSATKELGNPTVNYQTGYYADIEKALLNMSPESAFTSEQMSKLNIMVDQAIEIINYGKLGYVSKGITTNGITVEKLVPPE